MLRHWLTSTTAIALVLNTAAPIAVHAQNGTTDTQLEVTSDAANDAQQTAPQGDAAEGAVSAPDETDPAASQAEADAAAKEQAEAAQAEAEAEAEAEAAAKAEAEAEAAKAQAEAEEAAKAEAEAAATAQAEAEAAATAQAEAEAAQAQAEAEAAAKAQAEAEAAEAQAEAEADPVQEAAPEAETAEPAEDPASDAPVEAATDAEGQPETEAGAETTPETTSETTTDATSEDPSITEDSSAPEATTDTASESGTDTAPDATTDAQTETPTTAAEAPDADAEVLPEISAEAQAEAAQADDAGAAAAAAATGDGDVVNTQEATVTEEQARSSSEEFTTSASGQAAAAPAAVQPAPDDDDNDLLKALGAAAVAGVGAYAVGRMLNGGGQVVSNTGDRAVVREPSGAFRIIKDDDTLLRRPGSDVRTETFSDGSTRTRVIADDGTSTVTIRAADGRVLRRTRILQDGREVQLFDDTRSFDRVDVTQLQRAQPREYDYSNSDVEDLRAALAATSGTLPDRSYSLNQIRRIDAVRHLVPVIALDAINFATGSAVIGPDEAQDLSDLGRAMRAAIEDDPGQVFLIEGHTDTVGDASYNLALSDRRAESVALALTEYFDVPPSNMIVQGYGESDLRVEQAGDIRANRRGAVRNITPLLTGRR